MFLIVFLFLVEAVVEYPLALFSQFSIEDQHGFNKQTLGGWFKDQIKVLGLQVVLVPGLVYFLLWIIQSTGEYFYLYAGSFLTVVILFFVVAAPLCIMPMFYKFDKLEENSLKADIEKLAEDVKYPLSAIEVIDGSTRSGHSNAFQYGFGKIKKIVLFDTLLEQSLGMKDAAADLSDVDKMSKVASKTTEEQEETEQKKPKENEYEAEGSAAPAAEAEGQQDPEEKKVLKQSDFNYNNHKGKMEILAIVAHELGHWAHMDNPKGIALSVFRMYLLFFTFSFALKYTNMPADFGFTEPSIFVSLYLFMMLMTPVLYLL
jgi:STE24 endopeptidase